MSDYSGLKCLHSFITVDFAWLKIMASLFNTRFKNVLSAYEPRRGEAVVEDDNSKEHLLPDDDSVSSRPRSTTGSTMRVAIAGVVLILCSMLSFALGTWVAKRPTESAQGSYENGFIEEQIVSR